MTPPIPFVRKRDGRVVPFDPTRIVAACEKALTATGAPNTAVAQSIVESVEAELRDSNPADAIPDIERIQDLVEQAFIARGFAKTAKAYILYRQQHAAMRDARSLMMDVQELVTSYTDRSDWRVNENSNAGYSYASLLSHVSGSVIAHYTLANAYPEEIAQAHREGAIHIHDLSSGIVGYCAGWSLRNLLLEGFRGSEGRASAGPARHFDSALGQIVNFLCTLQTEWAGAQAFSSFDTLLAPFVRFDGLDYGRVKQYVQQFVFGLNIACRWGQTPFTNLTFDWTVPPDLATTPVIHGGEAHESAVYGDFVAEMAMINRAFLEVMAAGDYNGRIFTFPIPTYNITTEFDWDSPNAQLLFEVTGKYGLPYFQNFVNSDLQPSDVRSMCCRLRMDLRELRHKTGGLFGSGEQTGSIGVVTINLPRLGYLATSEVAFIKHLAQLMDLASSSLEIKRKLVDRHMGNGLLPYTRHYLGTLDRHFATIGLVGMNEACLNLLGCTIADKEGHSFACRVLDFMRNRLTHYQATTGRMYNLEATPAEGTAYRLARLDRREFPDIITAGTDEPYYTNSTQLPVGYTDDIFAACDLQDALQTRYTGGTVLHGFLGERIESASQVAALVKALCHQYAMPYFTLTPSFSICPEHGYIAGAHATCPHSHSDSAATVQAPY